MSMCKMQLFADDTVILCFVGDDINKIRYVLQRELDWLYEWHIIMSFL